MRQDRVDKSYQGGEDIGVAIRLNHINNIRE